MLNGFQSSAKWFNRLLVCLIAVVVFVCYQPVLNNGFVWDDNANLIENHHYRGLSLSHLHWMFTTYYDANYHPLVWLTLGFDFVLWGMNPWGYHLSNIALHVLNAILLYFLIILFLRRTTDFSKSGLTGGQLGALGGALFFAVHPLRVEPVAWISARADLLCGIFYILTIIAYLKMNENTAPPGRLRWFLLAVLFFVGSLLSRAWGMTLPVILLILDIYPLGRASFKNAWVGSFKNLVIEKLVFILLAVGSGLTAFWVKTGSMIAMAEHGLIDRFMQAMYGLGLYLFKTILPIRLSPFYLLDKNFNPIAPKYMLAVLFVLGVTLGLTIMRHKWPWALTAWICYAVIVSPLLGFVQSGPQIAADRYTYISCMPFAVLAGAGMQRLWRLQQGGQVFSAKKISALTLAGTILLVLGVVSFRQTGIWYDSRTFLDHIIKLDPENYIAYYDRGLLNERRGNWAEALADYSNVVRVDPEHAQAYNNRGILRNRQGDWVGALADFDAAIRLAPASSEAYANRGMIRLSQNDFKRALEDFSKALEKAPASWPHRAMMEQQVIHIREQLGQSG